MNIRTRRFAAFVGLFVFRTLLSASTATTTTVSVIPSAPEFGQEVSLIATVTPSTATGYVSFVMDGGILVGSATVNSSGVAEATSITLPAGSNSLVAVYGGNTSGGYAASQSAALSFTVTAVPGYGFRPHVDYGAALEPSFAAVADFNGDGIADLAVADEGSSVSVLLGNGNGTFQTAVNYGTGDEPEYLAVGDFNGDGIADLAVSNYGSNSVSILLGNGNGTFQTAVNYGTGIYPLGVVVADFNGDGIADLAVVDNDDDGPTAAGVSVLLGNGNGTFQTAVSYSTGGYLVAIAVGDFNGDGRADLVVTNYFSNSVSVLLGNGDGTFQTAVNYRAGTRPYSVAVGDFKGDGLADLAVADYGSNSVSVLLGNGNGTFQTPVNYAVGYYPEGVAVGDFNGDGIADLVVANASDEVTASTVSVLLGNGNGTFQTAINYLSGGFPASVVVEDFNGDGIADLAVPDVSGVSVLLGQPTRGSMVANAGTTPQSAPINTVFPNALAVTVSDPRGNPIPGVTVTFMAPQNGASGTFGGSSRTIGVVTSISGIASAPITANSIVGAYTVTATAPDLPTVDFDLTNCLLQAVCVF